MRPFLCLCWRINSRYAPIAYEANAIKNVKASNDYVLDQL